MRFLSIRVIIERPAAAPDANSGRGCELSWSVLGCPASSIRERIYALPGVGYGVLFYTGTSDAEGTLGGLIQVVGGRPDVRVLDQIGEGRLCSQRGPDLRGTDPGFRLEGSVNRAVLAEPPLQVGPLG
jgi:hypothetical protein